MCPTISTGLRRPTDRLPSVARAVGDILSESSAPAVVPSREQHAGSTRERDPEQSDFRGRMGRGASRLRRVIAAAIFVTGLTLVLTRGDIPGRRAAIATAPDALVARQ